MARLDWDKTHRARLWREGVRNSWSGHVPPAQRRKASERQIEYLQVLLVKNGRRRLTVEEAGKLTVAEASQMIDSFLTA